jgi:hypothetical protein
MLRPTTDQMCVNGSLFCTYPLREKWVADDVACFVRLGLSGVPIGYNITYPLLTKWVCSTRRASL